MSEKLNTFDYNRQLKKGFALVSDISGNIIKDKEQVKVKDTLQIRFADFKIKAETIDIKEV
jgi:exonuclease VII large subunit